MAPQNKVRLSNESEIQMSSDSENLQKPRKCVKLSTSNEVNPIIQKIYSGMYFKLVPTIKSYYYDISEFLQSPKTALFVFGPSGCGKSTLVKKILERSNIPYQVIEQKQYEKEGNIQRIKIKPLHTVIIEQLNSRDTMCVKICYDFPTVMGNHAPYYTQQIRQFKNNFKSLLTQTYTKIIFILNQQIYNSYYILSQNQSNAQSLIKNQKVKSVRMQKFGKKEMTAILKNWVDDQKMSDYYRWVNSKEEIDEIVEMSSGDLRKGMGIIYWKQLQDRGRRQARKQSQSYQKYVSSQNIINTQKSQKSNNEQSNRSRNDWLSRRNSDEFTKPNTQHQKLSLYHSLGKLLYAKRLNIKPGNKKKNQISCYYTQAQLKQSDPPFYFDPVNMFYQSRVSFDIFTNLLQENYIERFGTIKDVKDMSNVFRFNDFLWTFKDGFEDDEVNQIKVQLITWGMVLCNKNSNLTKGGRGGLQKIQKSQNTNLNRQILQKKKMLKQYFPQHRRKDLLTYSHLTRKIQSNNLLNKVVFPGDTTQKFQKKYEVSDNFNLLNDEQEKQQQQILQFFSKNRLQKQLDDMIRKQQDKRKQLLSIFEDEIEDDISISDEEQ